MKLLVCDVEGTIFEAKNNIDEIDFAQTIWQPPSQSLAEKGISLKLKLAKSQGPKEYNVAYPNCTNKIYSEIHKPFGLEKKTFDNYINNTEYMHGVKDFFHKLDRKKYMPVLLSGGFQEFVRKAKRELNIQHGHGAYSFRPAGTIYSNKTTGKESNSFFSRMPFLNTLFYKKERHNGKLVSLVTSPFDFEEKYKYLETMFDIYKLNPKTDWVFIGDGKNDCDMAKKAPISFSINGNEQLNKIVTYSKDKDGHQITSFNQIHEILLSLNEKDFERRALKLDMKIKEEKRINSLKDNTLVENREINYLISEKDENSNGLEESVTKYKQAKELYEKYKSFEKESVYLKNIVKDNKLNIQEENYYTMSPPKTLDELLEGKRVAFVGMEKDYSQFQYLDKKYKNLKMFSCDSKQKNFKDMEIDFVFVYTSCATHPIAEKVVSELKAPYWRIGKKISNTNKLENYIANVLYIDSL